MCWDRNTRAFSLRAPCASAQLSATAGFGVHSVDDLNFKLMITNGDIGDRLKSGKDKELCGNASNVPFSKMLIPVKTFLHQSIHVFKIFQCLESLDPSV